VSSVASAMKLAILIKAC